jgi:cytochrome c biogenesis protein
VSTLLKALKSVRLALILIAYLAVTGILASLVPQGSNFYGSLLFLVPAFLFFANLIACSTDRFVRELKKGRARRHGPDILHLGLILLVIGAAFGQSAKQSHPSWQGFARLGVGDAVELPNGRILALVALDKERYPDGRPKDWISTVEVRQVGRILSPSYKIRVNHPLRMGTLSIYQASYGTERVLELIGPSGAKRSLAAGEYIDAADGRLMLMSVDAESGIAIARKEDSSGARTISLTAGSKIGAFTLGGAKVVELSGLQAAYDPAYPIVIAALVIIVLGIFITFARKLGDSKE